MMRVVVFVEGQTEEQFIKRVVAPALAPSMVYLHPQMLNTSKDSKGGAVCFDRLKWNARNTLRMSSTQVLTTFLDLYALDTDFPSFDHAKNLSDLYSRVTHLENALRQAIIVESGCRGERFVPYIQPHEFEGLLFSDVAALCGIEPEWRSSQQRLVDIRKDFDNPEHINDGYETKPSKRLENILSPKYRKTRHGPLAAERITLEVMEAHCPHFHDWMETMRALAHTTNKETV